MPVDRLPARTPISARASDYLGGTTLGKQAGQLIAELSTRAVPGHWTSLFGVVTIACVIVIMVTGVFLMFFYTPSSTAVTYSGSYPGLHGVTVSKAFDSTMHVSFDVQGGMLMRQAHHWAALLLPAAVIMQLVTTFFTGAFRKPRQGMWVLLFVIFIVALVGGWSGYALPDDMLSGTGLRIVEGIVLGIPVIGTWISALLFGGEFPGEVLAHLYPIHVAVVPVLLIGLLTVRIRLAYAHKPAQFAGPGRTEERVVGMPMLPNAAAKAGGLLLAVVAILVLISALFTISPIWLYGPASGSDASAGSQPDWYTGFLDGALRLVPPGWEFVWLDRTWSMAILVPLAVVGAFLALVLFYPFIEGWITGDKRDHNILDRPRNTPTRTAIGVAGIVFYGTLWAAGSGDVIAHQFHLSLEAVVVTNQLSVIVAPAIAFFLTRRVCYGLQRKDVDLLVHGYETGRIVRLPHGEYTEVHKPLDDYQRRRIIDVEDVTSVMLHPDARGRVTLAQRLRATLSHFFFDERILPPSPPAESARAVGGESAGRPSHESEKPRLSA